VASQIQKLGFSFTEAIGKMVFVKEGASKYRGLFTKVMTTGKKQILASPNEI